MECALIGRGSQLENEIDVFIPPALFLSFNLQVSCVLLPKTLKVIAQVSGTLHVAF